MTEVKPWSADEVARLRTLVAEGWSIAEMAVTMGRPKNSIGSKMNQLGLESPTRAARLSGRAFHYTPPASVPAKRCTYIAGERWRDRARQGDVSIFCGAPTVPGLSYCLNHVKRCYTPSSRGPAAAFRLKELGAEK